MFLRLRSGRGRREDDAKRIKSAYDTKLHDMPIEILERILIKVVTMEVKSMKLVKSVWQKKASHVVGRLRTVCPKWNYVLTTDDFQNELQRTLDKTDEDNVRLKIITEFRIDSGLKSVVALNNDLYVLRQNLMIEVYDPSVVPLSKDILYMNGMRFQRMAACAMTAAVYVVCKHEPGRCILRVTKTGPQQYKTNKWIERLYAPVTNISVSSDGCLVLLSTDSRRGLILSTYDPDGRLMNKLNFDKSQTDIVHIESIVRKPNGRFLIVATDGQGETRLREVSAYGETVRIHESLLDANTRASLADRHGRLIVDAGSGSDLILLDQEFNIVPFTGLQTPGIRCSALQGIDVASDQTRMSSLVKDGVDWTTYRLVVFCFIED